MNNLPHIISKVTRQPWVITAEKLSAIMDALNARQSGEFKALGYPGEDEGEDDSARGEYREFQSPAGTVAVIPVHGILGKHLSSLEMACGGCSLDTVQTQLKVAAGSPRIRRILLDVHSPGGTVTGTPETGKLIAEIAAVKPVWAFTDSECCSGALWLASQCTSFYATESANIGSVGVRMVLLDYSRALEEEGIKVNAISSGKYKLLGANFKPLTDEERDMLQTESDRIHDDFKRAVSAVRPVEEEHMQGQIFRGEEASGIGMIDGVVDDLDDVLAMLAG
jgi:protease-4